MVSTVTAVAAASSSTVAASLTATGGSSTEATVIWIVSEAATPAVIAKVTVRVAVDGFSLVLT